jgi:hypothetical protein
MAFANPQQQLGIGLVAEFSHPLRLRVDLPLHAT